MNLKRSITAKEDEVKICFLHTDTSENEFFSTADIGYHPRLMKEKEMLSSAHVNAALTRAMNDSFLDKLEWRVRRMRSGRTEAMNWLSKEKAGKRCRTNG